jgi:hypothetical protein
VRLQSTRDAEPGDLGFFGEALEPGSLFLFQWDLRLAWEPAPGFEFAPYLRVSNEDETVLTEGAEQLSSRWGSATLRWQREGVRAALGAFPARLSPLLLQRWDEEDAPSLGGGAGCPVCAAGVAGLTARSLEVLEPPYLFEGASLAVSRPWLRIEGWAAVPRWEKKVSRSMGATPEDSLGARYRRTLAGAAVDLGPAGREDPVSGLRAPVGVRLGYLHVGDDRESVPETFIRPATEWHEDGYVFLARVEPFRGLAADLEQVWWEHRLTQGFTAAGRPFFVTERASARAVRTGVAAERRFGRIRLLGRAHRLWAEPGFEPLYAALTYEPNEEGARGSLSVEFLPSPKAGRPVLALSGFVRVVEETEPPPFAAGAVEKRAASLSLSWRPLRRLLAEGHWLSAVVDYPGTSARDRTAGFSLNARWEGWPSLDPILRFDAIRTETVATPAHTVLAAQLFVRAHL